MTDGVLMDLAGETMLTRVYDRVSRATTVDQTVIATTSRPIDQPIVALCDQKQWGCYQGSGNDLLDRYFKANLKFKGTVVVRVTADCPLIDPEVIDLVVQALVDKEADYASNVMDRTYPKGLEAEAISAQVLARIWRDDLNLEWREHVTSYIQNHREKFYIRHVRHTNDYSRLRWTVDTAQDIMLMRKIYNHFQSEPFSWLEVIDLMGRNPGWWMPGTEE